EFALLLLALLYLSPWLTPPQLLSWLKFLVLQLARQGLKGFVERLVMQTVFDVLESQARSALLPDAVISAILSQLTVTVNYTPLECPNVRSGEGGEEIHGGKYGAETCMVEGERLV
ncbi:hypothetical protein KIN20_025223, partial [Parelaphostrongylus tenuis]